MTLANLVPGIPSAELFPIKSSVQVHTHCDHVRALRCHYVSNILGLRDYACCAESLVRDTLPCLLDGIKAHACLLSDACT